MRVNKNEQSGPRLKYWPGSGKMSDNQSTLHKKHSNPISKFANERRSEADVRNDHLKEDALLLRFDVERKNLKNSEIAQWRSIEKKGFKVTTFGCIFSHKNHFPKGPQKLKAPEAALAYFKGQVKNRSTTKTTNQHGWPCVEQISHLCHRSNCCAYKTLCIEPQWKNLKRNYCGIDGTCDCGIKPECLSTYHNSSHVYEDKLLTYSTPNVGEKLRQLFNYTDDEITVTVKLLEKNHYQVQDMKRVNRMKRKRSGDKTKKQTKEKAKKKIET